MSKYSDNKPPNLEEAIGWMYEHIEKDKVFLDFGCSTGYFGSLIKQAKNNKVYGVEISEDAKEAAKVLDGIYSFDIDGEWPQKIYERKYDYIFFGDVIEHLKDPQKALEKCKGILNQDGLIFISTPNIAHISIRLELMGGNFDYEPMGILDNTHLKYFTKKSLSKLVTDAGYVIRSADFSANDYPDEIIKKLLNSLGLNPAPKFWEMVNQPEARAFQHKFIIAPSKSKLSQKHGEPRPNTQKPEFFRNAELDDLKNKVKNLEDHAKKQAVIIEHYVAENQRLLHKGGIARAKRLIRYAQKKAAHKDNK